MPVPIRICLIVSPTHSLLPPPQTPPPPPKKKEPQLTLHKSRQHLTPRLQQRMTHHNLQEPLQPLPPMLNHIIAKPIREHLPRQRRDGHARTLALQDVAEGLEFVVAAAHGAAFQLEGWDVGAHHDLVRRVHAATDAWSCVRAGGGFACEGGVSGGVGVGVGGEGEVSIARTVGHWVADLGHAISLAGDLTGEANAHVYIERERAVGGAVLWGLRIPRFRGSSRAARTAPRRTAGAHRGSTASWAGKGGRELLCGIVCMRVELERCGRAMMAPRPSHAKGGAGELRSRPMAWTTVTCGQHR